MMKISRREKYMLLFLAAVIVCYLLYIFALNPLINDYNVLKDEHATVSQQYQETISTIKQKVQFEEQLKVLNYKLKELSKGYLKEINQENLIVLLNKYINDNSLDVSAINFSAITAQKIDESNEEDTYDYINISIAFTSTYENMISFIDTLQNSQINFTINNLSFLAASGNSMLGTMSINVYSINSDSIEEYDELIWKDLIKSGSYNPFIFNTVVNKSDEASTAKEDIEYDFVMSVKPTSSDLPTLVFGQANSSNSDAYVYDDINAVCDLIINFKYENGKYYYQCSTNKSSYPNDNNWAEFTPNKSSNVNLKIYSSARNSKEDASGAHIIIDNQAKLTINVYINDDDRTNPRVTFENKKGIVINND